MIEVVTVAFVDKNRLLVVKPRSSRKSNKYTLIGGKVEKDESMIDAIIRETKEELGLILNKGDLKLVLEFEEVSASDANLKINMHMFISNRVVKYPQKDANIEILEYKWIDIYDESDNLSDSISKHLLPYLKHCSY